jgi:hypothetical protein
VKKHAPGLKCRNVSLANGSEGAITTTVGIVYQPNMTNFLLPKPDFFFDITGPAQKAVPVPFYPFFGKVFMALFFFQIVF